MKKVEKQIIEFIIKNISGIIVLVAFAVAIIIRKQGMNFVSDDYLTYLYPWYEELKMNTGFKGLALDFYTYYIPYMCILAIATYIENINLLTYIKVISIISEFACAVIGGLISYHLCKNNTRNNVAIVIAVLLISPSIMLNGAYWGQCDYIYVAFILGSIYLLLKKHPSWSFILLGIAFCFKIQTVFILPAYALYYLCKKEFSFLNFLYIPLSYIIAGLPAIIAGRPMAEVYKIYFGQMTLFDQLSMNIPNIWRFFPNLEYDYFYKWGICTTIIIFLCLAYVFFKNNYVINDKSFLMICVCSVGICIMFLPGMHERYGALYTLLVYIYFLIYDKKNVWMALVLDCIVCMTYFLYLFGLSFLSVYPLLALINLLVLYYLIYSTIKVLEKETKSIGTV